MGKGARGWVAAVCALAAVGAAQFPAVAAEDGPDPDRLPPYELADTVVRGTRASTDAPALEPGSYRDTIAPGQKKYYAVDLDSTSDAYVAAFAFPEPRSTVAHSDGIMVELESADDTTCFDEQPTFDSDGAARPVGDYVVRRIGPDLDCQRADRYLFSVERISDEESDQAVWPLELSFMVEPGLEKGEPVPDAPRKWAATPPAGLTQDRRPVRGGTGFEDAPAIGQGVWGDRILPGQTLFYRVPVEWGEQLFAEARFANADQVTDDRGYASEGIRMELFNPARGLVSWEEGPYAGEKEVAALGTAPVSYAHRDDADADYEVQSMRMSGWYYLAVSLHPETADFVSGGVSLNVLVRLEESAEAEEPPYDGDATAAGFGVTDADRAAARRGVVPGGAGADDVRPVLAVAGLGTGSALVLGLAGWTLIARRRAAGRPGPA